MNLQYNNLCTRAAVVLTLAVSLVSCKKEWLDARSNSSINVPQNLDDYQALLDNTSIFRTFPILSEVSSDNFNLESSTLANLSIADRNAYLWEPDIFQGTASVDWSRPYQKVFYSNVVLEGLQELDPQQDALKWNNAKGSALFYRGHAFYELVQQFALPYDAGRSQSDPGIPLRLNSDIKVRSTRATVQQSYDQIISDLMQAIPLLPVTPLYKTRPSKPAAYALLARTYMAMNMYDKVLAYSDSCLKLYNDLLNFNTLAGGTPYPFPNFNKEVIFFAYGSLSLQTSSLQVDTLLYKSYEENDLRRTLFYSSGTNGVRFRGNYTGTRELFGGIATDEVYLMRAEAYARNNNSNAAMDDLNTLLETRWEANEFTALTATDAADALSKILVERRKELAFRIGLRWMDLKRLNSLGYNITLQRAVNNKVYTLAPNDKRYALPIPENEILESGFEQNQR